MGSGDFGHHDIVFVGAVECFEPYFRDYCFFFKGGILRMGGGNRWTINATDGRKRSFERMSQKKKGKACLNFSDRMPACRGIVPIWVPEAKG
ncbi:hypothetical protein AVEN_59337-1 [Araneus ventricosus]|uniref:Uncharacterized protein n=1 Tax=Araneus ventricosus TaxID=182803 RepID=A0A4Y2HPC7_ARAVE|nr:hypothetical protein AVEN_59337-1 [Araneus ventricosus]